MKTRVLSSISLILTLVLCLLFLGTKGGVILISIVVFFAQRELYQLLEKTGFHPCSQLGLGCGIFTILGAYFLPDIFPNSFAKNSIDAGTIMLLASICIIGLSVLRKTSDHAPIPRFIPTIFGVLYIPFMFQFCFPLVKYFEQSGQAYMGLYLGFWVIAVAKSSDIGGLIIGNHFGRNKLLPHVSPQKTWEGAIGGVILSVIVSLLFVTLLSSSLPETFTPLLAGCLALPIAVTAIISDLLESLIKRQAKEKDSGILIPGFGGMLDLVDSLLLSFPVGFLLLKYIVIPSPI